MFDERLRQLIEGFLDANYACRCGDADCPGNFHEAVILTELVQQHQAGRA